MNGYVGMRWRTVSIHTIVSFQEDLHMAGVGAVAHGGCHQVRACGHMAVTNARAQDDVESADGPASRSAPHGQSVARTYTYETERACEAHLGTFLTSIQAAGKAPGQGFAAIKVPRRFTRIMHEMRSARRGLYLSSCKCALCMQTSVLLRCDLVAQTLTSRQCSPI